MPEKPFNPEALNEAMALANAIAQREIDASTTARQISAELKDTEYEPADEEVLRAAYLGQTAMYLAKVTVEDAPISATETFKAANPEFFVEVADKLAPILGKEVNLADLQDVTFILLREKQEITGATDEELTKRFARTLSSARAVAADRGVDVATVYSTDKFYYEALGREFSLAEMADRAVKALDAISLDAGVNAIIRNMEKLMPPAIMEMMSEEELVALLMEELQTNSEIRSVLEEQFEISREISRQTNIYLFDRVFGPGALARLPLETQSVLTPHKPLVSIVRGDS